MPTTTSKEILAAAIEGFEVQKKRIDTQIADLQQLMTGGTDELVAQSALPVKRRKISTAGRKRMAEAQRKRWAAAKKETAAGPEAAKPTAKKPKRKLSAEGRKRIIEATKERWAALRAAAAKTGK